MLKYGQMIRKVNHDVDWIFCGTLIHAGQDVRTNFYRKTPKIFWIFPVNSGQLSVLFGRDRPEIRQLSDRNTASMFQRFPVFSCRIQWFLRIFSAGSFSFYSPKKLARVRVWCYGLWPGLNSVMEYQWKRKRHLFPELEPRNFCLLGRSTAIISEEASPIRLTTVYIEKMNNSLAINKLWEKSTSCAKHILKFCCQDNKNDGFGYFCSNFSQNASNKLRNNFPSFVVFIFLDLRWYREIWRMSSAYKVQDSNHFPDHCF